MRMLQQALKKQAAQLERVHQVELKNVRAVAIEEAAAHVRRSVAQISKQLSKEQQTVAA